MLQPSTDDLSTSANLETNRHVNYVLNCNTVIVPIPIRLGKFENKFKIEAFSVKCHVKTADEGTSRQATQTLKRTTFIVPIRIRRVKVKIE